MGGGCGCCVCLQCEGCCHGRVADPTMGYLHVCCLVDPGLAPAKLTWLRPEETSRADPIFEAHMQQTQTAAATCTGGRPRMPDKSKTQESSRIDARAPQRSLAPSAPHQTAGPATPARTAPQHCACPLPVCSRLCHLRLRPSQLSRSQQAVLPAGCILRYSGSAALCHCQCHGSPCKLCSAWPPAGAARTEVNSSRILAPKPPAAAASETACMPAMKLWRSAAPRSGTPHAAATAQNESATSSSVCGSRLTVVGPEGALPLTCAPVHQPLALHTRAHANSTRQCCSSSIAMGISQHMRRLHAYMSLQVTGTSGRTCGGQRITCLQHLRRAWRADIAQPLRHHYVWPRRRKRRVVYAVQRAVLEARLTLLCACDCACWLSLRLSH